MNSRIVTSLIVLMIVSLTSFGQTIHRVNNRPGITGTNIYSTIQAAHDGAANGDLIYIEGTPTQYDGFNCTKQLTFIGPGYHLDENGHPQAEVLEAFIKGPVKFQAGSSGSKMYGVRIPYTGNSGEAPSLHLEVSDLTMSRNYLGGPIYIAANTSNLLISQNIFWRIDNDNAANISNLVISNNIIIDFVDFTSTCSGVFENNTMGLRNWSCGMSNFTVTNNIYVSTGSAVAVEGNNNTFSNNIGSGAQFPVGNSNQQNVSTADIFVVDPGNLANEIDNKYLLKAGSPAIGAGLGGVDCGAFGGVTPYVLSGIPPYPSISSLIHSGVGSTTSPLTVTISTKSNE